MSVDYRDRYDSLIKYWAAQYNLDWKLVKAQMLTESAADPRAISSVGAQGLMQFMPTTWREWGHFNDPFNPEESIKAGCAYLKLLINKYGDEEQALAAYNWGMGNVAKHGEQWRQALPPETRNYIERINAFKVAFT